MSFQPSDVQIRNFQPEDIEPLVNYWLENSAEFWLGRGIDKTKFKSKTEYVRNFEKIFRDKGEVKTLATIVFQGVVIGVHGISDLVENESAVFHADIWSEAHRGRGIGVHSYIQALDFFMTKLNLQKMIFKTPKSSVVANRLKEKLGLPCLGDTVFDSPILMHPLEANLYEIDRAGVAARMAKYRLTPTTY
jgi:RimJ/RimL family protein N-acetyltransferase